MGIGFAQRIHVPVQAGPGSLRQEAFPGKERLPATEEQLRRLERQSLVLRQERDVQIKAIAVLSPKP